MNQYNAIDLFCGAGGLSYGFECAGFNILLGIDSDQKALRLCFVDVAARMLECKEILIILVNIMRIME